MIGPTNQNKDKMLHTNSSSFRFILVIIPFVDEMLLQEDLIEILPAIGEANSISEELDKKKKFEVMLVSGAARGDPKGRTQVRGGLFTMIVFSFITFSTAIL